MVLLIGIGDFIGAVLRYLMSGWIQNGFISYPIGTLGVNFIGSFLLNLIMYLSEYKGLITEENVKIIFYEENRNKAKGH